MGVIDEMEDSLSSYRRVPKTSLLPYYGFCATSDEISADFRENEPKVPAHFHSRG